MKTITHDYAIYRSYVASLPLAVVLGLSLPLLAQDEVVTGILTVEDDLILKDRDIGATSSTAKLFYEETAVGEGTLFSWLPASGAWTWGYGLKWTAMHLDQNHVLRLYNIDADAATGNAPTIVLDPGDGAVGAVPPSITIAGEPVLTAANSVDLLAGHYFPAQGSELSNGSLESFLLEGAVNGAGRIPKEGAGTRMMWYPEKAAFRVGRVNGSQWDDSKLGKYSVAMGNSSQAKGTNSFAMGHYSVATGENSTAVGSSQALGRNSTALGRAYATGNSSTAMGLRSRASEYASTAMGGYTTASGDYSTAMGGHTTASGEYSTAMGRETSASGYASLAIGQYNESRSTVTGQTAWTEIDQNSVLEVGIGTESNPNRNALTVMKDGSVEIGKDAADDTVPLHVKADGSVVLAKAQGDISMGIYGQ